MTISEFYTPIYKMFNCYTHLSKDCGMLCERACCKDGEEERKGMLLFPGEEKFLEGKGFGIERSNWEYAGKKAYVLFCNGVCNRDYRPLGCRIFPLTPLMKKDSTIKLIMNPLAKGICPLARSLKPSQLEPEFNANVKKALNRIKKLKDGKAFLNMISDISEDYMKF